MFHRGQWFYGSAQEFVIGPIGGDLSVLAPKERWGRAAWVWNDVRAPGSSLHPISENWESWAWRAWDAREVATVKLLILRGVPHWRLSPNWRWTQPTGPVEKRLACGHMSSRSSRPDRWLWRRPRQPPPMLPKAVQTPATSVSAAPNRPALEASNVRNPAKPGSFTDSCSEPNRVTLAAQRGESRPDILGGVFPVWP